MPRSTVETGRDAVLLAFLSLIVNVVRLGSKSITFDEAGSASYAQSSFDSLLQTVSGADPNMTLYYLVLSLWVRLFGDGEWAVRLPSALFGALAVGACYLVGRHLYNRATGILAALLLALNPFMVQYAQTARAYSLVVLLVTLSSYALAREIDRPSTTNRVAYGVTTVLAVYAHYFTVYVLAAHLFFVVAAGRTRSMQRWLRVIPVVLLSCAPAVIIAYRSGAGSRINWIRQPVLLDVMRVFASFTRGSLVLLGALALGGCAALLGRREGRAWPHALVLAWLLVPIALSFAVSRVKPMFLPHYLILCLPPLLLFGAAGITRLRPPLLAVVLAASLLCVTATRLLNYYRNEATEDWRAAAHYVFDSTRPGDGFVFFPQWAEQPFRYYARRQDLPEPDADAVAAKRRIWFVVRTVEIPFNPPRFQQLRSSLLEISRLADRRSFAGVDVELYLHNDRP